MGLVYFVPVRRKRKFQKVLAEYAEKRVGIKRAQKRHGEMRVDEWGGVMRYSESSDTKAEKDRCGDKTRF